MIYHSFFYKLNVNKMIDLFNTPISEKKVRKNVIAYKYRNGCINIEGKKFFFYSMSDAIKVWRNDNPLKK